MEGEGESEAKVRVRARAGESDRSIDRAASERENVRFTIRPVHSAP